MSATAFVELAQLGEQLQGTTKRGELVDLLAGFLKRLLPEEVPVAVPLVIGQVFPEWDSRALNVSWKALTTAIEPLISASAEQRDRVWAQAVDGGQGIQGLLEASRREPVAGPELTLVEVHGTLEAIATAAGRGSRGRKEALLRELVARATPLEAKYLAKIILQEMRHGVNEGILLDGIARASGVKPQLVRRAHQFWGDLGEVATQAMSGGEAALRRATPRPFRPIKPMLAQTAEDMEEAFDRYGGKVALEYKLDGARVQVHRGGDEVRIYSRNLADVTASLPDLAAEVRAGLDAQEAILDGEALAVDGDGRPLPFQHLMRRFRRKHGVADSVEQIPVQLHLFDILYVGGRALVDSPYQTRWAALEQVAGGLRLVPRMEPTTAEEAQAFADEAQQAGHEGVMAKELGSPYLPGVRGKAWLKLKHVESLDLVIVAADWGYGRRHGWLSNYHLAVRDPQSGEYQVVGKTFKGLTDAEFQEMTRRLLELEAGRRGGTVHVQARIVVEVLFNEIQASSQYRSGYALRFARIGRIREDKSPSEADSPATIRRLFEQQFAYKGRLE